MKIEEARQLYGAQLKACQEHQTMLLEKKKELEKKMNAMPDGRNIFAREAATLELSVESVRQKQDEYQEYMNKLLEQWAAISNMESAKQQGEAMEEYVEDIGKLMEVARRLMKGGIVPASDEKKLMEYSMELYQAAKSMGAMMKQKEREEYDSLWEDEEVSTESVNPTEIADNAEAFAEGPELKY